MLLFSRYMLVKSKEASGFSLLEMLVALSVFSALSLMGLIVLRSYTDGQIALQNADQRLSQIQIVGNIVRDDLANAIIRPAREKLGGAGGYFGGGISVQKFGAEQAPLVRFVRGGYVGSQFNTDVPGIQTLEYWFNDNSFVRRSYSRPDATEETPVTNMPLVQGLNALSVRFRVQGTWVDGLEAISSARPSLPEMVELTFEFSDAETLTRVFAVGVRG